MICWIYLLCRAARRQHAVYAHRHSVQRARQLHDQYVSIGRELLAALQAQMAAEMEVRRLTNQTQR